MRLYINNLTALRGIAALLVVIMHFDLMYGAIIPAALNAVMDHLYLMVDMFFILSGFVMCYVYQDMFAERIRYPEYRKFLLLRLARIYPLHFATLVVEVGFYVVHIATDTFSTLHPFRQYSYQLSALPVQLLFLDTLGIFDFVTWNSPAWSLSAEWWAYVCFPFIFIFSVKFRRLSLFLLPVFALSVWFLLEFYLASKQPFVTFPPDPNKQDLNLIWHWGALRGIAGFVAGMFVYHLYQQQILRGLLANGWALMLLFFVAVASMQYSLWDTLTVSFFSLIILSAAFGSECVDSFFKYKPLQKLGEWSFSIYLWHLVIFHAYESIFIVQGLDFKKALPGAFGGSVISGNIIMLFAYIAVVLIVARMSYKYIEKPARNFLRKRIEEK